LVTDEKLTPGAKAWVAPMDIFHAMVEADPPIVSSVTRLASRETVFQESYRALDRDERKFVDGVLGSPEIALETHLAEHDLEDPSEPLNVLLDRFAYDDQYAEYSGRRDEVLLARFQHPPKSSAGEKKPTPPHDGQKPTLIEVSGIYNDELGEGLEVHIRPAYFDFLSRTVGTAPYSELSMADTRIVVRDGNVRLRRLEAVRVTALNADSSDLPGSARKAWRVRLGLEDRDLSCDDCLLGYAEGGFGKGYEVMEDMAVYGLATGRLEAGDNSLSTLQARASAGMVWNGEDMGLHMEGGYLTGVDGPKPAKFTGQAEMRFSIGNNWQWRTKISHDEATEYSASLNFYW